MSSTQATEPHTLTFRERCERFILESSWIGDFPTKLGGTDVPKDMTWIPNRPQVLKISADLDIAFMGQYFPGKDSNKAGQDWNMNEWNFREHVGKLIQLGGDKDYLTHNYCRLVFWFAESELLGTSCVICGGKADIGKVDESTDDICEVDESNGWTNEMENAKFPTEENTPEYSIWNGDSASVPEEATRT